MSLTKSATFFISPLVSLVFPSNEYYHHDTVRDMLRVRLNNMDRQQNNDFIDDFILLAFLSAPLWAIFLSFITSYFIK